MFNIRREDWCFDPSVEGIKDGRYKESVTRFSWIHIKRDEKKKNSDRSRKNETWRNLINNNKIIRVSLIGAYYG